MRPSFLVPLIVVLLVPGTVRVAVAQQVGVKSPVTRETDVLVVRDFGARGDGQADDTAAIQRRPIMAEKSALRAAPTASLDRSLSNWTALVTRRLWPMARPRCTWLDRAPLKFIGTHAGTAAPQSVKDEIWQRQRTPMIDGWRSSVTIPRRSSMVGRNLSADHYAGHHSHALDGIYLTRRARNVILSNCHLYNNRGVGLLLERLSLHQVNIDNCHISYNGGGESWSAPARSATCRLLPVTSRPT